MYKIVMSNQDKIIVTEAQHHNIKADIRREEKVFELVEQDICIVLENICYLSRE